MKAQGNQSEKTEKQKDRRKISQTETNGTEMFREGFQWKLLNFDKRIIQPKIPQIPRG